MKILHTSDWHLGQNFIGKSREEEHRKFTEWLLTYIKKNPPDALIISGDIFDTGTPPNYALKIYYGFLSRISSTECGQVIIIAGNHDSASTLAAPSELLNLLDITVIAEANPDDISEEIITIKNKNRVPIGILCAVPYLKERNVRKSAPGETYQEKNAAYTAGIIEHYNTVYKTALKIDEKLPVIAMGHLTASGSSISDSEKESGIGGLSGINITPFADKFDYFALGHMHKYQKIRKNIIYSGSPIPLGFGEAETQKYIISVKLEKKGDIPEYEKIKIPQFKKLIKITCKTDEISSRISEIKKENSESVWLQLTLKDPGYLYKEITESIRDSDIEVLAVKSERRITIDNLYKENPDTLKEITPYEVFIRRLLIENNIDEYKKKELKEAFEQILIDITEEE